MSHPSDGRPGPLPKNWISDISWDDITEVPKIREHFWKRTKFAYEKGYLCCCNALLLDRMIKETPLFENATWTGLDLLYFFQELNGRNWISREKGEPHVITNPCPPYESKPEGR